MTNDNLQRAINKLVEEVISPIKSVVLDALDKLIDSEESAWQQLDEFKANDKSMQEPRNLNTTIKILDN